MSDSVYLIKSGAGGAEQHRGPAPPELQGRAARGGVTFTAGPGATSSRTCAQMLMTFSRWEKSCSTMGTRVRSPRAGHTSSCLVAAALASSSEVHELLRDLGALAVTRHTRHPRLQGGGKGQVTQSPTWGVCWTPPGVSGRLGFHSNLTLPCVLACHEPSLTHPQDDRPLPDQDNSSSAGD